jgi:hypothetical protein
MTFRMTARTVVRVPEPKVKQQCGWYSQLPSRPTQSSYSTRDLVLVIEEKPEIVSLYRYAPDGRCLGNSRHRTVDGARQQAGFEFNDFFLDWVLVPAEVEDVISFELNARNDQS